MLNYGNTVEDLLATTFVNDHALVTTTFCETLFELI